MSNICGDLDHYTIPGRLGSNKLSKRWLETLAQRHSQSCSRNQNTSVSLLFCLIFWLSLHYYAVQRGCNQNQSVLVQGYWLCKLNPRVIYFAKFSPCMVLFCDSLINILLHQSVNSLRLIPTHGVRFVHLFFLACLLFFGCCQYPVFTGLGVVNRVVETLSSDSRTSASASASRRVVTRF